MRSELFSEEAADKEVISSLINEIERLRGNGMSKIIKSSDGKYYEVRTFEELSGDDVNSKIAELKGQLAELEAIAPAQDGVVDQPVPEQPADPAPAPTPDLPTEQPVAPVDSTAGTPPEQQPVTEGGVDTVAPAPITLT